MRYRNLGRSSLRVSEVGFGAWVMGTDWWGSLAEGETVKLAQRALDLGINFIDTSDAYADGLSETLVGKVIEGRREDVVLSTKFGYDIYSKERREGHSERPQNFTPQFIRFALDQSLKRLGTEYIDLYQLHNPKMDVLSDGSVFETLKNLKSEGKIRCYGVALGPAIGWLDEGMISMRRGIVSLQTVYNMVEQDPARSFFAAAQEHGVGVLVRVPHASGLLDGKFKNDTSFSKSDHRSFRQREWLLEGLKKIEVLNSLVDGKRTMAQIAIKFALMQPSVSSVLPTATSLKDLEEYAFASDLDDLTDSEVSLINEVYERDFQARTLAQLQPMR